VATVSATVTSHVKHFPCCHGICVRPSGRFPSDLQRPAGSLTEGLLARHRALQIRSFSWWWRVKNHWSLYPWSLSCLCHWSLYSYTSSILLVWFNWNCLLLAQLIYLISRFCCQYQRKYIRSTATSSRCSTRVCSRFSAFHSLHHST